MFSGEGSYHHLFLGKKLGGGERSAGRGQENTSKKMKDDQNVEEEGGAQSPSI